MKTEYTITIKDIYEKDLANLIPPTGYKFSDFRYPREGEKYLGLGVFQPIEAQVNHSKRTGPPYLILTPTPKVKELVFREVEVPASRITSAETIRLNPEELGIEPSGFICGEMSPTTYGAIVSKKATVYRLHSRREIDSDE